jgi:hypothetical protein
MTRTLALFLMMIFASFHVQSQTSGKDIYYGASIGVYRYTTWWYYYRFDGRPNRYNYPVHKLHRVLLSVEAEKRAVWTFSSFQIDIAGEFQIGVGGKTTGEWLPNGETISSGGITAGLGGQFKIAYPVQTGALQLTPFFGLGPQFNALYCNGKGLGQNFASAPYYGYGDGWTEFLLMLGGSLGCRFSLDGFDLTPALRFGVIGTAFTNWQPNEDGVQLESSPTYLGFQVAVSKKF